MEIANSAFEMLWHLADEVLEAVRETPEGASDRAIVREFASRGISPEMFCGIVAELESAGLVRWRGNRLFRALRTEVVSLPLHPSGRGRRETRYRLQPSGPKDGGRTATPPGRAKTKERQY
jgi:hypothetical protein